MKSFFELILATLRILIPKLRTEEPFANILHSSCNNSEWKINSTKFRDLRRFAMQGTGVLFFVGLFALATPLCLRWMLVQAKEGFVIFPVTLFLLLFVANELIQLGERWEQNRIGLKIAAEVRDLLLKNYNESRRRSVAELIQSSQKIVGITSIRDCFSGALCLIFIMIATAFITPLMFWGIFCGAIISQVITIISSRKSKILQLNMSSIEGQRRTQMIKTIESAEFISMCLDLKNIVMHSAILLQSKIGKLRIHQGIFLSVPTLLNELIPFILVMYVYSIYTKHQIVDFAFALALIPFVRSNLNKITSGAMRVSEGFHILNDLQPYFHGCEGLKTSVLSSAGYNAPILMDTLDANIRLGRTVSESQLTYVKDLLELHVDFPDSTRVIDEHSVSGGQRSRIDLARKLLDGNYTANDKEVFASIDPAMAQRIKDKLKNFVSPPSESTQDDTIQKNSLTLNDIMNEVKSKNSPFWIPFFLQHRKVFLGFVLTLTAAFFTEICFTKIWRSSLHSDGGFSILVMSLYLFFSLVRQYSTIVMGNQFTSAFLIASLKNFLKKEKWTKQARKHFLERLTDGIQTLEFQFISNLTQLVMVISRLLGLVVNIVWISPIAILALLFTPYLYIQLRRPIFVLQTQAIINLQKKRAGFWLAAREFEKMFSRGELLKIGPYLSERVIRESYSLHQAHLIQQASAFASGVLLRSVSSLLVGCMLTCFVFTASDWAMEGVILGLTINISDQIALMERSRRELQQAWEGMPFLLQEEISEPSAIDGGVQFDKSQGIILVHNPKIYFPDGDERILPFQFVAKKRKATLITGRSGIGKSSLLKLLANRLHGLLMNQTAVLASGTLKQNIDPNDRYSASDLIINLQHYPEFAHVPPLENSVFHLNLSTEQEKIIAFERIILMDGELLCLDEPTATLSEGARSRMIERINERSKNSIVILASHCPETIRAFNLT